MEHRANQLGCMTNDDTNDIKNKGCFQFNNSLLNSCFVLNELLSFSCLNKTNPTHTYNFKVLSKSRALTRFPRAAHSNSSCKARSQRYRSISYRSERPRSAHVGYANLTVRPAHSPMFVRHVAGVQQSARPSLGQVRQNPDFCLRSRPKVLPGQTDGTA